MSDFHPLEDVCRGRETQLVDADSMHVTWIYIASWRRLVHSRPDSFPGAVFLSMERLMRERLVCRPGGCPVSHWAHDVLATLNQRH